MNKENPYRPFITSEYEGSISLLLTDLKWDAFEQSGFEGNGYDWSRLIENMLKEKSPNILATLNFDSEADMFCVRSKNTKSLRQLAEMVNLFYDDQNALAAHILKYAQYQ